MTLLSTPRPSAARRRNRSARFSLVLEGLETRTVLSAGLAPAVSVPVHVAAHAQLTVAASVPLTVTGINITQVTQDLTTGVLTAVGTLTGSLLGQDFTTPVTATITPAADPTTCPVLNLHLGPIHLSLLGLNVDTSPICLDITAQHGEGLLGDLLCGGLEDILGTASGATTDLTGTADLTNLLSGPLSSLLSDSTLLGGLNNLLGRATAGFGSPSVTAAAANTTSILHLSLGPVDLNLLGLNVHLDNCSGSPITVDITATQGGGILGDLLSSLDNLLSNGHASNTAINSLLRNIITVIEGL